MSPPSRNFDDDEITRIQSAESGRVEAESGRVGAEADRITAESEREKSTDSLIDLIEDTVKKYIKKLLASNLKNTGLIPSHNKQLIEHELRLRATEQKLKELIVRVTHNEESFTNHRKKLARGIVATHEFFWNFFLLIVGIVVVVVGIFILLIKVFKLL